SQRSGSGTHGGTNPVDENRHGASIDGHTQLYSAFSGTQNTMPPGWAASRRTRRNLGGSVTQQRRGPGETAAECFQQQVLATLHLARTHRVIERERHRTRG